MSGGEESEDAALEFGWRVTQSFFVAGARGKPELAQGPLSRYGHAGTGAFAVVWKATDKQLPRGVAIKRLLKIFQEHCVFRFRLLSR